MSGVILLISSILFITGYDFFELILCARLLAGLAHGIVYITTITHLAENLVKEIRGRVLALVNYMLITAIFLAAAIYGTVTEENLEKADMYFGVAGATVSSLGLILTQLLTKESVTLLLRQGRDRDALHIMMKLRDETAETEKIRFEMDELKLMISEEANEGLNIFFNGNLRPLLLITITKVLGVFTNNMILNGLMLSLTQLTTTDDTTHMDILTLARFLLAIFSLLALDHFPRKKLLTVTGALMVIVLLIYSVISLGFLFEVKGIWMPIVFFVAFQVIVSLGIDPMQHLLTAEAFNSTPKAYWSITFATTVEHLLQIVAIIVYQTSATINVKLIMFTTAFGSLLLLCVLEFFVPETNGYSIRQTRIDFKNPVAFEL